VPKSEKKPPVTSEQVQDWLSRYDQGETARQIANKDSYDVRTVRSHLQKAVQEREKHEARATVLRNALEAHYRDLCNFALKLDPTNLPNVVIPSLPADDEIMESALRQHIPRSPIWKLKVRQEKLAQEYAQLLVQTRADLEKKIPDSLEPLNLSSRFSEVISGVSRVFTSQTELRSQNDITTKISGFLRVAPEGNGYRSQLGSSLLGFFENKEDAEGLNTLLGPVIDNIEKSIKDSPVLVSLKDKYSELERNNQKLHGEISVIRMRRIVPGRCKFCPL